MTLKTKIMLVVVLLLGATAPVTSTAIAQDSNNSTAPRPTGPAPANETVVSQVDNLTVVTDYWVDDSGVLHVELYSNGGNKLTVTETTETDGATQVAVTKEWIPRGRYVLTVPLVKSSSWSVLITTRLSLKNERGTKLSESGGSLISGPFDGSDVRDVGLGSAIGVSFGVLLTAVQAKLGASERGERVA